ncbi:MAG: hypothetical protein JNL96_19900 [Planctomycetaceae bacterium]|nr:hypothetical protein [Planctomycetaceae bacterium]
MQDEDRLTPELQAIEARLAGLSPPSPALDRDRIMYEAGRASMGSERRRVIRSTVAVAAAMLAALFVGRWTASPGGLPIDRLPASVQASSSAAPSPPSVDSLAYLRRELVAGELPRRGSASTSGVAAPFTSRAILNSELLN